MSYDLEAKGCQLPVPGSQFRLPRFARNDMIGVHRRSSAVQAWLSTASRRLYKRTQFGWPAPAPEGRNVRNKPSLGRSFKFEVSSVKREKPMAESSNFTLYTSNSAEGRLCETNPISGAGRAMVSVL
jgi:hypothetical protein